MVLTFNCAPYSQTGRMNRAAGWNCNLKLSGLQLYLPRHCRKNQPCQSQEPVSTPKANVAKARASHRSARRTGSAQHSAAQLPMMQKPTLPCGEEQSKTRIQILQAGQSKRISTRFALRFFLDWLRSRSGQIYRPPLAVYSPYFSITCLNAA